MFLACPRCGLGIEDPTTKTCPKCDSPVRERTNGKKMQVDVAHSGEDLDQALRKLECAINEAISGNYRGLKVIHRKAAIPVDWRETLVKGAELVELAERFVEFSLEQSEFSKEQAPDS